MCNMIDTEETGKGNFCKEMFAGLWAYISTSCQVKGFSTGIVQGGGGGWSLSHRHKGKILCQPCFSNSRER